MIDIKDLLTNETLERAKKKEITLEEKTAIQEASDKILFKQLNSSCNDCYADAVLELILLRKKKPREFEERLKGRNYILKRGCVFQLGFGNSKMLVRQNCTDKLAIEFLAIDKNNIQYFDDYPEEWEEEVDKYLNNKSAKTFKQSKIE